MRNIYDSGILKSYDLIASAAYVVLSAADEFRNKTVRPNQLWPLGVVLCERLTGGGSPNRCRLATTSFTSLRASQMPLGTLHL